MSHPNTSLDGRAGGEQAVRAVRSTPSAWLEDQESSACFIARS